MNLIAVVRTFSFAALLSFSAPSRAAEAKPAKALAGDDLFAQPNVIRLKIDLSAAALDALKKDPKAYVKALMREGSHTYNDVGVRLKGSAAFAGLDKKPSLAIKFNEFVSGQKFHGETKVFLDNSSRDPSYLCESLAGQIFRDAGVPAARATFARVELNGQDAGLYVVAEAVNKDFLSSHFKKAKGNLYEGSNQDVSERLDKDSGDAATEQDDLKKLAKAAQEPDPAKRWTKLNPVLDLDRFVSFAAVEVLLWHRDGYSMDKNSYRIYNDPASGQMVFLPHGVDVAFHKHDGALWPEWKGLVAGAVLETSEGRQRYRERMTQLLSTIAPAAKVQSLAQELAAKIRPSLTGRDDTKVFDAAVAQLREHIAQRVAFLEAELKKPLPTAKP